MEALRAILAKQFSMRPRMTVQDGFKLIYQNEFGSGHLVGDANESLARLIQEIHALEDGRTDPLFESIGNGLIRLNLFKDMHILPGTVNAMFLDVANTAFGNVSSLFQKAELLKDVFGLEETESFLSEYDAEAHKPVGHSPSYREAYHPAYRLASEMAGTYHAIFEMIDRMTGQNPQKPLIVAIDGMSASGKTTLGRYLARIYGANLFHMDDFFLPFDMKTPERLDEAGGNVHYERFWEEVGKPLLEGTAFSYRPYDCASGALKSPISVTPRRVNIVEGAYAMHPMLSGAYDIKIALTIDAGKQSGRILARNGEKMHARFVREWIPMENRYLEAYDIPKQCDIVYQV